MATLDDLLARFPDNTSGEIGADDMRYAITELWNYIASVQSTLNGLVFDVAKMAGAGEVDNAGALVQGPAGWSATRLETGVYKVNHTLDTEAYSVVVNPMIKTESDFYACAINETALDSFTYEIYSSSAGGRHDAYSSFIVVANL